MASRLAARTEPAQDLLKNCVATLELNHCRAAEVDGDETVEVELM